MNKALEALDRLVGYNKNGVYSYSTGNGRTLKDVRNDIDFVRQALQPTTPKGVDEALDKLSDDGLLLYADRIELVNTIRNALYPNFSDYVLKEDVKELQSKLNAIREIDNKLSKMEWASRQSRALRYEKEVKQLLKEENNA